MKALYVDFEWNDYRGELISIGIAAEDGPTFYEEFIFHGNATEWVREHVLIHLHGNPKSRDRIQHLLYAWLWTNAPNGAHIVSDWPEDIARFCDLLVIGPGERVVTPSLTFEIVRANTRSNVPHHALEDAIALRRAFEEKPQKEEVQP